MLSPWDYAAGCLILAEAGGKVVTQEGKELTFDQKNSVVAGSILTVKEALSCMK